MSKQPSLINNNDILLLSDIIMALTSNDEDMMDSAHFVDLTTGEVLFVPGEIRMDEDIEEEDISNYPDWEQDIIRAYHEHELIEIEPITSHESFRVMEAFVESLIDARKIQCLESALSKRKPFANFRSAVETLGIIQDWYAFKDEAELKQAQEWLEENDLEIRDGKIQRIIPTE